MPRYCLSNCRMSLINLCDILVCLIICCNLFCSISQATGRANLKSNETQTKSRRQTIEDFGSHIKIEFPSDQQTISSSDHRLLNSSDFDHDLSSLEDPNSIGSSELSELNQFILEHEKSKLSNNDGEENKQQDNATNINQSVEKIVRNQVDLAATDWATMAPSDYLLSLSDLSQLQPTNKQRRPTDSPHTNFDPNQHPNHRYSSSLLQITTPDPMTSSSDASGEYSSYDKPHLGAKSLLETSERPNNAYPGQYLYRHRGPITSPTAAPQYQSNPRLSRPATLAPEILNALQKLDSLRSFREQAPRGPSRGDTTNTAGTSIYTSFSNPTEQHVSSRRQQSVDSNQAGSNISPQGFIDVGLLPPSPSVINGQQVVHHGDHNEDHADGVRLSTGRLSMGAQQATELQQSNLNVNGSLAARLMANRYKNRINSTTTTTTSTTTTTPNDVNSDNQLDDESSPLTINLAKLVSRYQQMQTSSSPVTQGSTLSAPKPIRLPSPWRTTRSPVQLQAEASTKATHNVRPLFLLPRPTIASPMAFEGDSRPTTVQVPSTPTSTSVAPSTTTPTTLLPPHIIAAALQAAASLRSSNISVPFGRPAHHHHLHSHIHSIKQPAVISIPVPVNPQPVKYDNLVAAAAAAAAAATSAARAKQTPAGPLLPESAMLSPQRQPLMAGNRLQVPLFPVGDSRQRSQPNTIPIGGTLASLPAKNGSHSSKTSLALNNQQQQQFGLFANLLDSANRVLKSKAANLLNLQPSTSNQVTSTHTDLFGGDPKLRPNPLMLPVFSDYPQLFVNQRGGDLGALNGLLVGQTPAETLAASTEALMGEPIDLFQVPSEESSPLPSYLGSSSSSMLTTQLDASDWLKSLQDLNSQPYLESSSDQVRVANSNYYLPTGAGWPFANDSNQEISDFDDVIFAPLGGDSSVLYPIKFSELTGGNSVRFPGANKNGQQQEELPASSWDKLVSMELHNLHNQKASSQPSRLNQQVDVVPKASQQTTTTNARDNSQPQVRVKKPTKQTNKNHPKTLKTHFDSSVEPIPYALTHYIDQQLSSDIKTSPLSDQLLYDIYHQGKQQQQADGTQTNNQKFSVPEQFNFLHASADDYPADGFRPMLEPLGKFRPIFVGPANSSQHVQNDQYASNNEVIHRPPPPAPLKHKSKPPNLISFDDNSTSYKSHHPRFVRNQKEQVQQHELYNNHDTRIHVVHSTGHTDDQHHHPAAHLIELRPILASDVHQAAMQAGSQLRPHIVAASELIHGHKQHLLDHILHQHDGPLLHSAYHPADMATSESSRLGAIAPLRGGLLLSHFWPLALALLPIMIVVAIVAQLVMAAPLAMFALTTLTVSRFAGSVFGPAGPVIRSDRDEPSKAANWTTRDLISSIWADNQPKGWPTPARNKQTTMSNNSTMIKKQ